MSESRLVAPSRDTSTLMHDLISDGIAQEANEVVITLDHEEHPIAVEAMLQHFYEPHYNDQNERGETGVSARMVLHARVLILADKYDPPDLANLAVAKFVDCAGTYCATENFADAAEIAFCVEAERLRAVREIVAKGTTEHAVEIIELDRCAKLRRVAGEIPALGAALWSALAAKVKRKSETERYKYRCCHDRRGRCPCNAERTLSRLMHVSNLHFVEAINGRPRAVSGRESHCIRKIRRGGSRFFWPEGNALKEDWSLRVL